MINHDYRSHKTKSSRRVHLSVSAFVVSISLIIVFSLAGSPDQAEANVTTTTESIHTNFQPLSLPLYNPSTNSLLDNPDPHTQKTWLEYTIKSGDSLSNIFEQMNLSYSTLKAILAADKNNGSHLNNIQPNQKLLFLLKEHQLIEMLFTPSIIKTIHFKFIEGGNHYTASIDQREVDTRIAQIHATINDSLYSSGINSGMSENLIMELVNIFAWDIDFALDIRKGDQFTLIFERVYLDGGYLRDGNILAASFTNQGNNHTAIMFRDDDGSRHYFTPDGKSLKKAFLRSPVDFRRISSTFQKERFHPVYGKKRPHKGVDYAAKTGTTIKASGDGTVMFKGRKGGYGRTIILQHGHRYQTLYAHMSGYKRGIKTGQKVRQGQTIGFVGRSGVVTGPHLHYEFRVNGQHKNPLRVKFPDSSPIEAKYHKAFSATATHYSSLLDLVSNQQIALN